METIIINFAVKWRKQVSLDRGSGSNQRLLSNSSICAPGETSAGCRFPLPQQLRMNWNKPRLPRERWVGMWLVVPQPYGARKGKISGFKPSWHLTQSPLRSAGVPGSDLCNKQPLFPDKAKKVWFSLALRICCVFFKGGREPQRTFCCFPPKTVLLAADHLSRTQALKCIFSLSPPFCRQRRLAAHCPLLSQGSCFPGGGWYLPAPDGDGAQREALPRRRFPGQCAQQDRPAALLLRQSIGVSPALPPQGPSGNGQQNPRGLSRASPSTSSFFLRVKIWAHPPCVVFALVSGQNGFTGWSTRVRSGFVSPSSDFHCR